MFQGYVLASLIGRRFCGSAGDWRLLAVGCYHILFLDCFVIHIRKVTKLPLKFPNSHLLLPFEGPDGWGRAGEAYEAFR